MVSRYPVTLGGVVADEFNQLIALAVGLFSHLIIIISLISAFFRLWCN